jgi:hypothetical protein
MKTAQYQPSSRSARSLAAVAAIATVVALFEVVSGLGETKEDALAARNAPTFAPVASVAGAAVHTGGQSVLQ